MTRPARLERLLIGLILLAGIALRLQNLPAIEHNTDHAYPIWQALTTLEQGHLPLTGQGTSILFDNPALTGYLFILPLLAARTPFAAYLFVVVLNNLAVWFTYRAARPVIGAPGALMAAFLLAVNPWVVEYSRTTWVQSLLPFFATLVFFAFLPIWRGTAKHPRRRFWWACAVLAAMTQTYLLAFLMIAPVGVLTLAFGRYLRWRTLLIGALIVILPGCLYGAGLLANGETTFRRLREFTQGGPASLRLDSLGHALRLVSGRDYPAARGLEAPIRDATLRQHATEIAHLILSLAMLAGAISMPRTSRRDGLILAAWFLIPGGAMLYTAKPVHPFYLLLTLPVGHMLAGAGLTWVLRAPGFRRRGGLGRFVVAGAGLILALALGLLHGLSVVRYAEETLALPGAHGLTALPVGDGTAMIVQLTAPGLQADSVVFADVESWILNSLAGRLFLADRDTDTARAIYVPTGGALHLRFETPADDDTLPFLAEEAQVYTLADGTRIRRWWVRNVPDWAREPAIPSDSGMSFAGALPLDTLAPGGESVLYTAWRVDVLLPARKGWLFGPFAHLYDANGARVQIVDGSVTPGGAWRLNDYQVKSLILRPPLDSKPPYRIEIGQYDGTHGQSMIFTLPDGRAVTTIPLQ